MNDPDHPDHRDPASPAFKHALLRNARREFAALYEIATVQDIHLMDALILAHVAMMISSHAPRQGVDDATRAALERQSDTVDHLFASLREAVRGCAAFQALPEAERQHIDRTAFHVYIPSAS